MRCVKRTAMKRPTEATKALCLISLAAALTLPLMGCDVLDSPKNQADQQTPTTDQTNQSTASSTYMKLMASFEAGTAITDAKNMAGLWIGQMYWDSEKDSYSEISLGVWKETNDPVVNPDLPAEYFQSGHLVNPDMAEDKSFEKYDSTNLLEKIQGQEFKDRTTNGIVISPLAAHDSGTVGAFEDHITVSLSKIRAYEYLYKRINDPDSGHEYIVERVMVLNGGTTETDEATTKAKAGDILWIAKYKLTATFN